MSYSRTQYSEAGEARTPRPFGLESSTLPLSHYARKYFAGFNPLLHKTPFDALKYNLFENIMENGAFALLEQMFHFFIIFSKVFITLF